MKMTKEFRDEIVGVLYEKCTAGEISVEEREELIQEANTEFAEGVDLPYDDIDEDEDDADVQIEKACVKETADEDEDVDDSDDDDKETKSKQKSSKKKLSNKEKYELFKDTVYKKCKDGEITEDFREQLLEKARETFIPDAE